MNLNHDVSNKDLAASVLEATGSDPLHLELADRLDSATAEIDRLTEIILLLASAGSEKLAA